MTLSRLPSFGRLVCHWVACAAMMAAGALRLISLPCVSAAEEPSWIWSPEAEQEGVPQPACYFRKEFQVQRPERGEIEIAVRGSYDLYVNGRLVASGSTEGEFAGHDITQLLMRGRNLVAVKVTSPQGSAGALAARVRLKEYGKPPVTYTTDPSWKAHSRPLPFWNTGLYNDSRWAAAQERRAATRPEPEREGEPAEEAEGSDGVRMVDEFQLERLLGHQQTGSLIALTFNEFGHMLASREGGPLLFVHDSDRDGRPDRVRVYCDRVKNCQGILPLNGDVYVTAEGPEGQGIYRLADRDRNGSLEDVQLVLKFAGETGEHGAHGLALGPDGMLYVVVGNHALPEKPHDPASPYRNFYEGDLLQPRYEDPKDDSAGRKAPGGTVLRLDVEGKTVHMVAGGLRNARDLAFSREGDLFVHDTDTQAAEGTPWYRPPRLLHITAGGEYGWRSGWAKWPEYFVDRLPAILDSPPASPTGATFYNHYAFPARFHNALFLGDWSHGRILVFRLSEKQSTYSATSEVFLEGSSLRVMDLEVGPDGALYFVTGGAGAEGGIYRISWKGEVPKAAAELGEGISEAIRHPQLHSAWGRQGIARVRNAMGDEWSSQLAGVSRSVANPAHYRIRALHVMQLFGPPPPEALLLRLSRDATDLVRAEAAELMGLSPSEDCQQRLVELLEDSSGYVRRQACEALLRGVRRVPFDKLVPLLTSEDRCEAWAARRLLERLPAETWRDKILTSDEHRLFVQGALALLIAEGDRQNALAVVKRFSQLIEGFVSDRDFIDMLRVVQVALVKGALSPADVAGLGDQLAEEYPSSSDVMNRELVRILVCLQVPTPVERYLAFLKSDAGDLEKLHLAFHLRYLQAGWKEGQRLEVLDFYQQFRKRAGSNAPACLAHFEREFAKSLSPSEADRVLAAAAESPNATLGVLYSLPPELDNGAVRALCDLDRQLAGRSEQDASALRLGIVAVLGRSGTPPAMAYLRGLWDTEPERRPAIAMGLAQKPDGENFDYLLRSLPVVEGLAAREVLTQLLSVPLAPGDPECHRQVILRGWMLKDQGAEEAIALLRRWTGKKISQDGDPWRTAMKAWQDWYETQYPTRPAAELPRPATAAKWKYEELLAHLTSPENRQGAPDQGAAVFQTAGCVQCHQFGDRGERLGPDLTTVGQRLMKKQILESILYPAHVVSESYQLRTVITTSGRSHTGIVTKGAEGSLVVWQSNGERTAVSKSHVQEIVNKRGSVMREGLLDALTLEEITDLFSYLCSPATQRIASRRVGDAAP